MSRKSFVGMRFVIGLSLALLATTVNSVATADETDVKKPDTAAQGTRRALIVCGLTGDAERHKTYSDTVVKLQEGLTRQWGFAAEDVQILFGDPDQDADVELIRSAKRSTREELEHAVTGLREKLRPEDTLWVIVLGQSYYDGKYAWFNIPGQDIHQADFGKLFDGMQCREQLFVVSIPTSGYYIRALSAPGRIIFTATEADLEIEETEFPHELARVLASPPDAATFDVDRDGATTMFDLYLTVVRNIAQSYLERELLATEHALLDDNGDGRGTEVQIDYLTDQQGGRAKPNRPVKITLPPTADGVLSKTVQLNAAMPSAPAAAEK